MDRLYGNVGCAGIDTDVEYKYPKGFFLRIWKELNKFINKGKAID